MFITFLKIIFKSFVRTRLVYSYPLVRDLNISWHICQSAKTCLLFKHRALAVHTFIRPSFISDWICALPIKWTTVEPGTTWQRHVRHNVLLLAFSSGTAFGWHHFLGGLVVSSLFFTCTHTLELKLFKIHIMSIFMPWRPFTCTRNYIRQWMSGMGIGFMQNRVNNYKNAAVTRVRPSPGNVETIGQNKGRNGLVALVLHILVI